MMIIDDAIVIGSIIVITTVISGIYLRNLSNKLKTMKHSLETTIIRKERDSPIRLY